MPTYHEILVSWRIPLSETTTLVLRSSVWGAFYSSFINDFGSYTLQQLVMIGSTMWVAGFLSPLLSKNYIPLLTRVYKE